jgi:hypothetical protein
METDLAYYLRRACQEGDAAKASLHPKVRNVHLDMKRLYEERATAIKGAQEHRSQNLVSAA